MPRRRSHISTLDPFFSRRIVQGLINRFTRFSLPADDDEIKSLITTIGMKTLTNALKNVYKKRDRANEGCDYYDLITELIEKLADNETRDFYLKIFLDLLHKLLNSLPNVKGQTPIQRRFAHIRRMLYLSKTEHDAFVLAYLAKTSLLEIDTSSTMERSISFYADYLDVSPEIVRSIFAWDAPLMRFGCLDEDLDFNSDFDNYLNGLDKRPLQCRFFERYTAQTLPLHNYDPSLQHHAALLLRLLRTNNTKLPMNILLYGAPGTGKTSFAQTLAHELKYECCMIAQRKNNKDDSNAQGVDFRFAAINICSLHEKNRPALIVVDEADRMLCGERALLSCADADKGRLNAALDHASIPTIWIANTTAEMLDLSSRRRFDYAICFAPLNTEQRLNIWKNAAARHAYTRRISESKLAVFAEKYEVNAGTITLIMRNLAKLKPSEKTFDSTFSMLMNAYCELLQISTKQTNLSPAVDYTLQGLNIRGDISLENIICAARNFLDRRADAIDVPRMNLLLSGPPGTGKTEFVKYLGSTLKIKIIALSMSSILSCYVGGTEQNIRKAFARAAQEHALLFLDEIDGLLQPRENADHSWEVTQVNELLTQLENFQGLLVGATNFATRLDPAVLRRFTYKLTFDYLDNSGKQFFFEHFFG